MAFLSLCAAVVYFIHGNMRMAIYWLAAMVLTLAVTL
jgi:hypothetical protein